MMRISKLGTAKIRRLHPRLFFFLAANNAFNYHNGNPNNDCGGFGEVEFQPARE